MAIKLDYAFDALLDLEETRFDETVKEYIKVIETNRRNCSAFVTANREGVKLIKKRFKELNTSITVIETSWYEEDNMGDFKLLDIGI
jgi:hypothetical protein